MHIRWRFVGTPIYNLRTMPEPKFIPKPGQVDYTNIRYAPVVQAVVTIANKILLVQRSAELRLYPSYWNGISGFLDDNRSIEDKIKEELSEEIGIKPTSIKSIEVGQPILQEAPEYNKTWLVVPAKVEINNEKIKLNWENQKTQWIDPQKALQLNLMPGFDKVLNQIFTL